MPLPHYTGGPGWPIQRKDIKALENVHRITEGIYKIAKKHCNDNPGDRIPVDGDFYETFRVSDDEAMLIRKENVLDTYYNVKFLKGVFKRNKADDITFFCEEGTLYLTYLVNDKLAMWGVDMKLKDKTNKFGDDLITERLNNVEIVSYINHKLVKLQRDSRIDIILS